MALTALKGKSLRRKKPRRVASKLNGPNYENADKLKGEAYGKFVSYAFDFYRLEHKNADYKKWVIEYFTKHDKKKLPWLKKCPENRYGSTIGALCKISLSGVPDYCEEYNKHWEALPGTMGSTKPLSQSINRFATELIEQSMKIAQEKEKEEAPKKVVKEKINIQQRIFAQAAIMFEPIDIWVDKWYDEQEKFNPKGYDFGKHLRNVNCTQAHARKIRDWLDPELLELQAASNPPSKADRDKMNEHDKDDAEQLIEAYSCYTKKALEKKVLALQNILGACNVIIETAKANRKPRKRFRSKEKMVAKMKFAQNNDKFALASINPQDIINASELWVFNFKTRKIGRYVAKTIDPLHQGREGSGLSVKGTTIRDYNEELSVQKTLRKPEEKLKEFKESGPRKIKTFLDEINAVDIKLNGRINPDTILLKAIL